MANNGGRLISQLTVAMVLVLPPVAIGRVGFMPTSAACPRSPVTTLGEHMSQGNGACRGEATKVFTGTMAIVIGMLGVGAGISALRVRVDVSTHVHHRATAAKRRDLDRRIVATAAAPLRAAGPVPVRTPAVVAGRAATTWATPVPLRAPTLAGAAR